MNALPERAQAWLDRNKDMADFPGQAAPRELITSLIQEITALQARIKALEKNIEVLARAYGMTRWKIPRTNWDVMSAAEELYRATLAAEKKP